MKPKCKVYRIDLTFNLFLHTYSEKDLQSKKFEFVIDIYYSKFQILKALRINLKRA